MSAPLEAGFKTMDIGTERNPGEIRATLQDLLSVFEPSGALPSEFKKDSFGKGNGPSEVYKQLSDLIIEHSLKNYAFGYRIQEIITPDFAAKVFFDKMKKESTKAFDALEEYINKGPASDSVIYDVIKCAEKLQELVALTKQDYDERRQTAEVTSAFHATGVLVDILRGVVDCNVDAYKDLTWTRLAAPNEPARDRNLYVRLIGNPVGGRGHFVLDALEDISNIGKHHAERLDKCYNMLLSFGAPSAYLEQLARIMTASGSPPRKRSSGGAGESSSRKR